MKITVLKDNFKEAFSNVERAISNGNILPILKNVLIQTDKGRIKVAATDLEMGITSWVNGKIIEEGGITVPANILGSVLGSVNAAKLELEVVDSKLIIKTDKSENIIQGIKDSDFPLIPKIKNDNYIEIKNSELKKSLEQVVIASALNERRPEISGVLFWLKDKILKLVSTDTFRLAEKTLKSGFDTEIIELKTIVPLKTIQEVIRIGEGDKKIKIFIDSHQILFNFEETELVSRLIEGSFPEYEAIIPKEIQTSATVDRLDLLGAVRLAAVFVGKVSDIKIKVSEPDKMEISSRDSTIGENKSELETKISGPEQELVLNWRYLSDGLRGIDSADVFIGFNGDAKPLIIHSPKSEDYFYILMPIKNNN